MMLTTEQTQFLEFRKSERSLRANSKANDTSYIADYKHSV
jgi:hypothetical protein